VLSARLVLHIATTMATLAHLALATGQARADPVGAAPVAAAEAEARIRRGLELRRKGRDAEALEEFKGALALAPSARAAAQVALAEQALGRWVDAEGDLEHALGASDDPWIAKNRASLEAELATIRQHLARLDVVTNVREAELVVNGAALGRLRGPVRVEAGTLVVEARAPGYATARKYTSVLPGQTAREELTLVPLEGANRTAPTPSVVGAVAAPRALGTAVTPPDRARHPTRDVGWVLLGAGVVGAVTGSYFGVRTVQRKNDRDALCGDTSCPPAGLAADQEARALALRSTAWFVFASLALGGGGALLLFGRSSPATDALHLAPSLGPKRAGAELEVPW
jgi:tetratricopeptide (TPR) repeat protein